MSGPLPPYRSLRILLTVSDCGSIRGAAQRLNRSESAISHQIRALERQLGQTLIEKYGRGIQLTALARRYAALLHAPFEEIDAGIARLIEPRPSQQINVTLPPTLASLWLIPRLQRFEATWPEITLRLVTTMRTLDLEADGIDIAIRYYADGPRDADSEHVIAERAFPVCAPSIARTAEEFWRVLKTTRRIGNDAHPDDWARWQQGQRSPPALVKPHVRMADSTMTLEAAAQGYGIAIGRLPLASEMLRQGRLVAPVGTHSTSGSHYVFQQHAVLDEQSIVPRVLDWLVAEFASSSEVIGRST